MRIIVAVTLVIALAVVGGVLWVGAQTPAGGSAWNVLGFGSFRTVGAVMLNPGEYTPALDPLAEPASDVRECAGDGEFTDLHAGTRVAVLDRVGVVLASAELGPGALESETCMLFFELPTVPAGHGLYNIQIGERPPYQYTEVSMHRPKGIGFAPD
ncbi:hypothetical protein [Dactylosporangium matsuzakiense]|uniref:hypothetical protein n=1 Tax=Dactylosporangium matsuzakiense TaxID=53360 RepID=UPI0022F2BF41|nr:hypothetical protein [Dactylosporangium matsuzakiense]